MYLFKMSQTGAVTGGRGGGASSGPNGGAGRGEQAVTTTPRPRARLRKHAKRVPRSAMSCTMSIAPSDGRAPFYRRYLPYEELTAQLRAWAEAHPAFVRLESLATTPEGRSVLAAQRKEWGQFFELIRELAGVEHA